MQVDRRRGVDLTVEDVHRGLPWPVGVGIRTVSEGEVPTLWPGEEELLGPKALERRRAYFALGRAAARDALAVLGIAPVALGRGTAGEPLWPEGIVGAITHAGDTAVALVGRKTDYAGLGVDEDSVSEPNDKSHQQQLKRPNFSMTKNFTHCCLLRFRNQA